MNSRKRDIQLPLRILARLQQHTIKNPITAESLGAEFDLSRREVMAITLELIDAGHKIGSNKAKPLGIYIATHPIEVHETARRMEKEGIKYLERARKLMDWGGKQPTIFEQLIDVGETAERV